MIFLYAYILASLIFAVAMIVKAVKSEMFLIQSNLERFIGLFVVVILSFFLYPLIIADDISGDKEYCEELIKLSDSGLVEIHVNLDN